MTIKKLIEVLQATPINITDPNKEIKGGYAGDFLSFVMSKAPEDSAWFTVMSNINVAAVARLAGVGVIVCCEGVKPDASLSEKCEKEGIDIVSTPLDTYNAIIEYSKV